MNHPPGSKTFSAPTSEKDAVTKSLKKRSLILGAHGSLAHPTSNDPVQELAERIREREIFASVTPAFLHGDPEMTNVFEQVPFGDVVIVPVMTSDGYYLNKVIPGKLMENTDLTPFNIMFSKPLGMHPQVSRLFSERIDLLVDQHELGLSDTTFVLIGHGTKRNPNSGTSTYQLADEIRELLPNICLEVAFLDQDPPLDEVVNKIKTKHTVALPFLMSRGPHSTVDVPDALGLPTGPEIQFPLVGESTGSKVICDYPLGLLPAMVDLCVELGTRPTSQLKPFANPFAKPDNSLKPAEEKPLEETGLREGNLTS